MLQEEEEWAGARELVAFKLSTDIRRAGGPQPHPLRLVMHLPAGQPAGHLNLQGKRANHANSRPLTSPLGYNSVWNRVRGYFPQGLASIFARLRRCDPGSNLGPPVRRRTP